MTAEEYATRVTSNEASVFVVDHVALDFLREVKDALHRGANLDVDSVKILKEQRRKWQRFYFLVKHVRPELKLDGFERMVRHEFPEVYGAWSQHDTDAKIRD